MSDPPNDEKFEVQGKPPDSLFTERLKYIGTLSDEELDKIGVRSIITNPASSEPENLFIERSNQVNKPQRWISTGMLPSRWLAERERERRTKDLHSHPDGNVNDPPKPLPDKYNDVRFGSWNRLEGTPPDMYLVG